MIPNSMSFYAIGKAEKNLIIVELQFTGKLFGFPKDMKKKIISLLEVDKMVLTRLCSSKSKKYIIVFFGNGILTFQY